METPCATWWTAAFVAGEQAGDGGSGAGNGVEGGEESTNTCHSKV